MLLRALILFALSMPCLAAFAQSTFQGILLSKEDSTAIPFARIKLIETGKETVTDKDGLFHFVLSEELKNFRLQVSALGVDTVFPIADTKNKTHRIYLSFQPYELTSVTILGLTAKQVVEKAIASIPKNYPRSDYVYYSFYREYQQVNGGFKNLIEVKPVVLLQPTMEKNRLKAKEAFALPAIRRSDFSLDITDLQSRAGLPELFLENTVYHLENSSLTPYYLNHSRFHFDTSSSEDDYVISYSCLYSSDNHGIEDAAQGFRGESYETGTLVIDRASFAFKRIERKSFRNRSYNYPFNNNFLLPSRNYFGEFVSGSFIAEYQPIEGSWFLNKLLNSYTNDFFKTGSGAKEYTITENFEWQVDSVSRHIDESLIGKFYREPSLTYPPYVYDSTEWGKVPAFYFQPQEAVYKDLEQKAPIEEQFRKNSKGKL